RRYSGAAKAPKNHPRATCGRQSSRNQELPVPLRRSSGGFRLNAGEATVSGEATIAPIAANLFGEAGVKREAPPGQWREGSSVAPVQRQKATRFAGRRASQPCPFDDDGLDPAATQEISDRGADYAATAYKDPHSFTLRPHYPISDPWCRALNQDLPLVRN